MTVYFEMYYVSKTIKVKKSSTGIAIVTIYFIVFQLLVQLNLDVSVIFSMLFFAPFVILYMVYAVLKDGKPSKYTFEERFYDDWDYRRNVKENVK